MILFKEKFAETKNGLVWICSGCDNYHIKYGDVTITLSPDYIKDEYIDSFDPIPAYEVCNDCGKIHLAFDDAVINITPDDFEEMSRAIHALYSRARKEYMPQYRNLKSRIAAN